MPPAPGRTAYSTTRSCRSPIPQRKGDPILFAAGRGHPRRHHRRVARHVCVPAFRKDGTITAGSASQISDGAAAVVVMSKDKAEALGLSWIAEIGAHGVVAGPDSTLQSPAGRAIAQGCPKAGIDPAGSRPLSRSTRRSRPSASPRPRNSASIRRQGQRQRWRHRDRAPARHVRCAYHAASRAGVAASRRWHRCGRAVRRRRTGRCADRSRAEGLTVLNTLNTSVALRRP